MTNYSTDSKVYNGVSKLFSLSRLSPVGIMVYGSAEFMGIPWESVIKLHRDHLGGQTFSSLKQYADNFLAFIQDDAAIFTEADQTRFYESLVKSFYRHVVAKVDEAIKNQIAKKGGVTDSQVKTVAARVIKGFHDKWSAEPHLHTAPANHSVVITNKYRDLTEGLIGTIFQKLPLSDATLTHLRELPSLLFSKNRAITECSGLVIAGFGENEVFPSYWSFALEGIVAGQLKYRPAGNSSVTYDRPAIIVPFAQKEVVGTFMEGISPDFRQTLLSAMTKMLVDEYPKAISKKFAHTKGMPKADLTRETTELGRQVAKSFESILKKYAKEFHVNPVVQAVEFLPKDELAAVAESLVNLTSFRRRVSLDAETVGGPVDVAVISKGDGFIWAKRKHYFDPQMNPQFFAKHYGHARTGGRT